MEKMTEIKSTKGRGLIAGYKPNKISLYILLLESRRIDTLEEVLWNDMEKYKEKE